eukprot:403345752
MGDRRPYKADSHTHVNSNAPNLRVPSSHGGNLSQSNQSQMKQILSQSFDHTPSFNAFSKHNHLKGVSGNSFINQSVDESQQNQENSSLAQSQQSQSLIRKLQSQIKDLQQNLILNKEIINRLLSNGDANEALLQMIKDLTMKNNALQDQVLSLSSDKESLQTFAQQQAEDFMRQIKDLQSQSMTESGDVSIMKEQLTNFQKQLAEKENQCLKKDDELKKKKKELDKLKSLLEDNRLTSGMNKSFDIHQNNKSVAFDDLMNTSIDLIASKIQNKHNKSRDRSPSIPKLDFKCMKEFQDQDWLAYSKKLEDSIKILNQRISILEDENDKANQKYHKIAISNTKLYELNERLNQTLKDLKTKMREQKELFKEKMKKYKQCSFCNNLVEMSMSNFTMTYDKVNVSFDTQTINGSFHNTKGSFMKPGSNRNDTAPHHYETQGSNKGNQSFTNDKNMIIQRQNPQIYSEFQDMMNDYGTGSAKIDSQDISDTNSNIRFGSEDTYGGKPRIIKDSSKYVKKKSSKVQQQQPVPLGNIIQSVHGLSQILSPAQTFLEGDTPMQHGGSSSSKMMTNQTPTFNQNQMHVPKIGGGALKDVSSIKNQKLQQQFMNQQASRNKKDDDLPIPDQQIIMLREESDDITKQKQQNQQLQEQFKRIYVAPQSNNHSNQSSTKNSNQVNDPKILKASSVQRCNSDMKHHLNLKSQNLATANQQNYNSSQISNQPLQNPGSSSTSKMMLGLGKSQPNSKERIKNPNSNIVVNDDVIKIKRIKKQSITNRNSPTNNSSSQGGGSNISHHSNIIGNIMHVFDRRKKNNNI